MESFSSNSLTKPNARWNDGSELTRRIHAIQLGCTGIRSYFLPGTRQVNVAMDEDQYRSDSEKRASEYHCPWALRA